MKASASSGKAKGVSTGLRVEGRGNARGIIAVGPAITTDSSHVSGQAMMFQLLVDRLKERGVRVKVFDISERRRARTPVNDTRSISGRVIDYLKVLPRLWLALFCTKSIVYLTSSQSTAGFLRDMLVIWPSSCLGHIVVCHQFGGNYANFYHSRFGFLRFLIRSTLDRTHAIVVEGDVVREHFSFLPRYRERVHVIPNGLPEQVLDLPREEKGYANGGPFRLLYLSNMIESKGFWDVLEAVRILVKERGRDVTARFAGEFLAAPDSLLHSKPEMSRQAFFEYIERKDLGSRVSYARALFGIDKAEAFKAAHAFVLPSNYVHEGQPVSVLEAMAYGVVVIATNHRLIPMMVEDGTSGFLVPYGAPKEIAGKIEYLMDNPEELARLSYNSRRVFQERFTADTYISRMFGLLREVGV